MTKRLNTAYNAEKILCTREDIETAAAAMETPYLVAFFELHLEL
jgi:hypothetical protein